MLHRTRAGMVDAFGSSLLLHSNGDVVHFQETHTIIESDFGGTAL